MDQAYFITDFTERSIRDRRNRLEARYRTDLQHAQDAARASHHYQDMNRHEQIAHLQDIARSHEEFYQYELNQIDTQVRQHEQNERDKKEQERLRLYNLYHPNSPINNVDNLPKGSSFGTQKQDDEVEWNKLSSQEQQKKLYNIYHPNSPIDNVDDLPKGSSFNTKRYY